MTTHGYPTNQYVAASGILSGGFPASLWAGDSHPGFLEAIVAHAIGDYSVFLTIPIIETQARVSLCDHVQGVVTPNTVFTYFRPSDTEIRILAADLSGEAADRDIDVVVYGVLPP